ncbi:MAG TPA: hypothetical protein VGB42_07545 [Candidatus Thermoplasmatota archaeon]
MASKRAFAILLAIGLVSVAGLTAATGALFPRSIWGDENPGQGALHAEVPAAAEQHNRAGAAHEDNRDHEGNPGGNGTDDDGEEGESEDESEEEEDEQDQESDDEATEEDEGEDALAAFSYIQALSVETDMWHGNGTDVNWSRNWTHGNVSCSGSGNMTSGTITCAWPDMNWSRRGLNCSLAGGNFTVTWSPGNFSKSWSGGTLSCSWMDRTWERHLDDDSVGAAADTVRTEG